MIINKIQESCVHLFLRNRLVYYQIFHPKIVYFIEFSYIENADISAMEVIETKMNLKITDNDINKTHRIGKPKTKVS